VPAAAIAGGANHAPAGPPVSGGSVVPFFYGTNQYVEKFLSTTQTLDANQHEVVQNINPGGFLRGVRAEVRSTGGTLGTGALSGDGPWSVGASATLENIDGSPIIYPMPVYSHYARQWFARPWWGDPARRFDFSNTINPAFSLFFQPEIRHTAGVLANTDARALYRFRFTFAPLATFLATVGTAVAPAVTLTLHMESWAQPDAADLRGNPIEEIPPGLNLATIARRQLVNLTAAGAGNTVQMSNMGNELRLILWILRNSAGVRTDLFTDPIRWRLDNRSLGVFSDQEAINSMTDFYESLQNGSTRPTGVLAWARFFDPGRMVGQAWQSTTNATYEIFEFTTGAGGTGGSLEIITDEVVPVGPVPMELESI
jgi:hypothetical protein